MDVHTYCRSGRAVCDSAEWGNVRRFTSLGNCCVHVGDYGWSIHKQISHLALSFHSSTCNLPLFHYHCLSSSFNLVLSSFLLSHDHKHFITFMHDFPFCWTKQVCSVNQRHIINIIPLFPHPPNSLLNGCSSLKEEFKRIIWLFRTTSLWFLPKSWMRPLKLLVFTFEQECQTHFRLRDTHIPV